MEIRDGNPTHTHPVAQLSSTTVACGLPSLPPLACPPSVSLSILPPLETKDTSPSRWLEGREGV